MVLGPNTGLRHLFKVVISCILMSLLRGLLVNVQRSRFPLRFGWQGRRFTDRTYQKQFLEQFINAGKGADTEYNAVMKSMIEAVKGNDFHQAVELYNAKIRNTKMKQSVPQIVQLFLSMFSTKEHLPVLVEVVDDLRARDLKLPEIAFLSLIRCHCDANEVQTAWKYWQEMDKTGFDNRIRVFQPFFDAYERQNDLAKALELVNYIRQIGLEIREEQLATILRTFVTLRRQDSTSAKEWYPRIRELLTSVSHSIQGMRGFEMESLANAATGWERTRVRNLGILVNQLEDIEGAVLSRHNYQKYGTVIAYNITFKPNFEDRTWSHESIPIPRTADPYLPETLRDCDQIVFQPEKFTVLAQRQKVVKSVAEELQLDARQVYIPPASSRCPHCGGHVHNVPLTETERAELREAIFKVAGKTSPKNTEALLQFEQFLREQEQDFDYIVDGANVAYNNQNYLHGRFSYGQIKLVMQELERIGKRVLLIIPSAYNGSMNMIPNRAKGNIIGSVPLKENEKQFLQDLTAKGQVYSVPRQMNDDWFWMLSVVHAGRQKPCFVVTNDMMRDHALSTLANAAFSRLRTSVVVYYNIIRPDLMGTIQNSVLLSDSHSHQHNNSNVVVDTGGPADAELDGDHSRVQSTSEVIDRMLSQSPHVKFLDDNFIEAAALAAKQAVAVDDEDHHSETDDLMEEQEDDADDTSSSDTDSDGSSSSSQSSDGPSSQSSDTVEDEEFPDGQVDDSFVNEDDADSIAEAEVASAPPLVAMRMQPDENTTTEMMAAMDPLLSAASLETLRQSRRTKSRVMSKSGDDALVELKKDRSAYYALLRRDDLNCPGEVILYRPGNYSRDIQEAVESKRWHIPATDRMKWLCLKLEDN